MSEGEIAAEANPLITGEVVGDGCVALLVDFGARDVGLPFGQTRPSRSGITDAHVNGERSTLRAKVGVLNETLRAALRSTGREIGQHSFRLEDEPA